MSQDGGGSGILKGCILVVFLFAVLAVMGIAVVMVVPGALQVGRETTAPTPPPKPEPKAAKKADPPAPGGAAVKRIRDRGVLLVGMDTGEPPFTGTPPMYFPSEAGEPDGFDSALARKVATKLGAKDFKVVHAKYSGLEDLLLDPAGKVDVVISGYVPTDTEGLAWSKPYLEFGLCLVVPAKSKVKTVADLFGKPVGIFDDDAAAEEVARLVKGYTELVRLEDGYWDQLVNGRFAGFMYDYPYAAAEIAQWYKENPSRKGTLRIAQYNLTDSTYAVGVRADERDLLAVVDEAIVEWRASADYGEAIKRFLKGGEAVEVSADAGRVVVVQKGDTLSLIAGRELGAIERWPELWEKNRDRFPNPHLIDVGDKVVLP